MKIITKRADQAYLVSPFYFAGNQLFRFCMESFFLTLLRNSAETPR